ncbi:hypothetical protein OsI_30622 [Oryza sativa Indica Group]|uniref:Uncharacterized protein n=1 Tax=Oryza sativa subsp. indica TaxID=39946 RepID=B8BDM7_ORYSI|nr:hypothetical protein OsI_30622 [Oryza sativa Indica Group]
MGCTARWELASMASTEKNRMVFTDCSTTSAAADCPPHAAARGEVGGRRGARTWGVATEEGEDRATPGRGGRQARYRATKGVGLGVGVGDKMAASARPMITWPAGWSHWGRGEEEATPVADLVVEEVQIHPQPPVVSLN